MKILLTNDDGIEADGLKALFDSLPIDIECLVVAPLKPSSATGHSISLKRSITAKQIKWADGNHRVFAVDGTPVDCVKFALAKLKFEPHLLFSGVNVGPNTGVSIFYSGTVAAAREGLFMGIPAVAISMAAHDVSDFTPAVVYARQIIATHRKQPLRSDLMLNINIPVLPVESIKGAKITRQAPSRFVENFIALEHMPGAYQLDGEIMLLEPDGTSDEEAVAEGYISVTPLQVDLTAYHEMENLRRWHRDSGAFEKSGRAKGGNGRTFFKLH